MRNLIGELFEYQLQLFGAFRQNKNLSPFMKCIENILCYALVSEGVIGENPENLLYS